MVTTATSLWQNTQFRVCNTHALAEAKQGTTSEALDDIDLAMRIQLNLFSFEGVYPGLVEVYDAYGSILQSSGKDEEASEYCDRALLLSIESFGENHSHTAEAYRAVGEFRFDKRDYDAAAEHFEHAIEIRRNILSDRRPDTAVLYVDLAETQLALGEIEAASESAALALSICDELGLEEKLSKRAEAFSRRE